MAFHVLTTQDLLVVKARSQEEEVEAAQAPHVVCQVNCAHAMSLRWPEHTRKAMATPSSQAWRWMAPERQQGAPASTAADVSAFGMCILHVLTGEEPWASESLSRSDAFYDADVVESTNNDKGRGCYCCDILPGDVEIHNDEEVSTDSGTERRAILTGKLPVTVQSLAANECELIRNMCSLMPADRVPMAYVVN